MVRELFFDGRGPKCEWCGNTKESWDMLRHHFPLPRSLGGKATVNICRSCHDQFHYGGAMGMPPLSDLIKEKLLLQETAIKNKSEISVSPGKLEHNIKNVTINNSIEGLQGRSPEKEKSETSDPRIPKIIKFFIEACSEIKGFKPQVSWAAEGAMLKRYLKEYSEEDLTEELDWFLGSELSNRLGCTIKVALSNYVFNKWLAQRNV